MYVKDELGYKKRLKHRPKRPPIITLLCIGFVLYGFYDIITSYVHVYTGLQIFYPAFNGLMVVFGFVAISGVWSMEKWGPVSFAIITFLKFLTELIFINTVPWYLIIWVVLSVLFFLFFPKMRVGK